MSRQDNDIECLQCRCFNLETKQVMQVPMSANGPLFRRWFHRTRQPAAHAQAHSLDRRIAKLWMWRLCSSHGRHSGRCFSLVHACRNNTNLQCDDFKEGN